MKYLGRVIDGKDITNKEYVDSIHSKLDDSKLGEEDLEEFSNIDILEIWNQIMENSNT